MKFPSFIAGSLAVLALPPFYIVPVLFISFSVLLLNLNNSLNKKSAFWHGWWFGFGYFIFGLYWIANSLFVDIEKFWWLVPFAVAGIPFGLAFFTALVGLAYKVLAEKFFFSPFSRVFVFSTLWVAAEYARTFIPFGGFPWNLTGYSALFSLEFAQLASIGGVYLLSYLVVFLALVPHGYKSGIYLALYFIIAVGGWFYGSSYIKSHETIAAAMQEGKEPPSVRIIQPNIPQSLKWDPMESGRQFVDTVELVKTEGIEKAKFIIWPESAVPYHLNREELVIDTIRGVTPENSLTILGALRSEGESRQDFRIWNSVYAVSKEKVEDTYDKKHLVPFGEYVPFRQFLPLDKITPGAVDFSEGNKIKVITANGLKFLPLICYEIIFPELSFSDERPDVIVNVTNDGWFGNSTGPRQHLAMSQMRAIEQGVPVLRSANTGISAIINAHGRIIDYAGYDEKKVIDATIPPPVYEKTVYSSYQHLPFLILLIFTLALSIIIRKI